MMSKNEWIPVNDRLPEICEEVLVYTDIGKITTAAIYPTAKRNDYPYWLGDEPIELKSGKVTHWMYLPEPPAIGGDDTDET